MRRDESDFIRSASNCSTCIINRLSSLHCSLSVWILRCQIKSSFIYLAQIHKLKLSHWAFTNFIDVMPPLDPQTIWKTLIEIRHLLRNHSRVICRGEKKTTTGAGEITNGLWTELQVVVVELVVKSFIFLEIWGNNPVRIFLQLSGTF